MESRYCKCASLWGFQFSSLWNLLDFCRYSSGRYCWWLWRLSYYPFESVVLVRNCRVHQYTVDVRAKVHNCHGAAKNGAMSKQISLHGLMQRVYCLGWKCGCWFLQVNKPPQKCENQSNARICTFYGVVQTRGAEVSTRCLQCTSETSSMVHVIILTHLKHKLQRFSSVFSLSQGAHFVRRFSLPRNTSKLCSYFSRKLVN